MKSGVILTRNYQIQIKENRISALNFFKKRFARLYPLHLVTLISVAFFQAIIYEESNNYFIYEHNDLKHFFFKTYFLFLIGVLRLGIA
jgi:peptidoglycan/LPS O-acetylase OafA/YrhL